MKIIHLSDPHIYIDKIHGIDPVSKFKKALTHIKNCLLYTSPSPRDRTRSRMPSSA